MEMNPGVVLTLMIIALVSIGGGDFNGIYMDGIDYNSGGSIDSVIILQNDNEISFKSYKDNEPGEIQFSAKIKPVKGKEFPVFSFNSDLGFDNNNSLDIDLVDYISPQAIEELKDISRPYTSVSIDDQIQVEIIRRGNTAYIKNDMDPDVMIAVHRQVRKR